MTRWLTASSAGLAMLVVLPAGGQAPALQSRRLTNKGGVTYVEKRGQFLPSHGEPVQKRYVVRYPASPGATTALVIGAHGGVGGVAHRADGSVADTSETALDDLIGGHAIDRGLAYASFDRDGIAGTKEGLSLTYDFTEFAGALLKAVGSGTITRTYLVGLSMGGGIARYAAEDPARRFDGVVIVAGANGDVPTRLDRQAQLARFWPSVDPQRNPGLPESSPFVKEYAEAVGTPTGARAFWPFVGRTATLSDLRRSVEQYGLTDLSDADLARFRFETFQSSSPFADNVGRDNTTGRILVPTIEVVGTYDDIVFKEVVVYQQKVERAVSKPAPSLLHRLYQVEAVWHVSGDDDAAESFQYAMRQVGLGEEVQNALRSGPSYLPTVREAFDLLDRWVEAGAVPPTNRTIRPGQPLSP